MKRKWIPDPFFRKRFLLFKVGRKRDDERRSGRALDQKAITGGRSACSSKVLFFTKSTFTTLKGLYIFEPGSYFWKKEEEGGCYNSRGCHSKETVDTLCLRRSDYCLLMHGRLIEIRWCFCSRTDPGQGEGGYTQLSIRMQMLCVEYRRLPFEILTKKTENQRVVF